MGLWINGQEVYAGTLRISNNGTTTTIMGKAGDYNRIGDEATTENSLNSEDDLMITGQLEVYHDSFFGRNMTLTGGTFTIISSAFQVYNDIPVNLGGGYDSTLVYETADADALCTVLTLDESDDSGLNVPAWVFGEETNVLNVDLGLLDEVVEPHIVALANTGKLVNITNASSAGAQTTITTATATTFANSAVGDIVRVTGGTNATTGWYIIDTVTDGENIVVDRNWCSGAVSSDGAVQSWHKMAMITSHAIYLPTYDGAPSDSDIDINLAGAMAINAIGDTDKGQIYWRGADGAWSYITKTGGLSMTKEERVDPQGHEFRIGDTVKLVVDKINEDGSFHAEPVFVS